MRVKLASLRKNMGYSQEMMAEKLCISRSHYSQIESGNKTPSLEIALRIKQMFNYSNDDIFLDLNAPIKESDYIN